MYNAQITKDLLPRTCRHVPLRGRCSGSYPVWFSKNLITLLKKKNKAWRRYKTTGSVYDFETFKSLRRCFKADVAAVYQRICQTS
jgi:hypothetical protein